MKIEIVEGTNGKAIVLTGSLDIYTSMLLKRKTEKMLIQDGEVIVLDLSEVNYMDSSGIGSLITLLNQVKNARGKFYITGLQKIVKQVFKVAGLLAYFNILPKEEYREKFAKKDSKMKDDDQYDEKKT